MSCCEACGYTEASEYRVLTDGEAGGVWVAVTLCGDCCAKADAYLPLAEGELRMRLIERSPEKGRAELLLWLREGPELPDDDYDSDMPEGHWERDVMSRK